MGVVPGGSRVAFLMRTNSGMQKGIHILLGVVKRDIYLLGSLCFPKNNVDI